MIKANLKALLDERGMSMYKLAQDTGLAYTTLWKLENGGSQGVSFDVMEKIFLALNCTPNDLFLILPDKKAKTSKVKAEKK